MRLLWPERERPAEIANDELRLSSYGSASHYQREYRVIPKVNRLILLLDTAFKDKHARVWAGTDLG